jgi:thiol-disulfide isomerase/thioredoxin
MKFSTNTSLIIIVLLVIGAGFGIWSTMKNADKEAELTPFAQCLQETGAKFYGAFWCPHCQSQKELFGKAKKDLPYVECSTASKSQKQECTDIGIESYPTWIFGDESKLTGEIDLETLSEKTGCMLPGQEEPMADVVTPVAEGELITIEE